MMMSSFSRQILLAQSGNSHLRWKNMKSKNSIHFRSMKFLGYLKNNEFAFLKGNLQLFFGANMTCKVEILLLSHPAFCVMLYLSPLDSLHKKNATTPKKSLDWCDGDFFERYKCTDIFLLPSRVNGSLHLQVNHPLLYSPKSWYTVDYLFNAHFLINLQGFFLRINAH